jgi:glycosyltransferase involved in cell wall biosynthesis
MSTTPTVHIIVPVQSMAALLDPCLASLRSQLTGSDRVTVVDDASVDATAAVARAHGADVITLHTSRGPYAARNIAAKESDSDALLFVDARCRAREGWLDAHRELLARPGAVLSCTNVDVVRGRSIASRIAHVQEPFDITTRVGVQGRWDWYPTANLGVSRSAFEAVGGFQEIRSGADEDLCRRVQLAGLGAMAANLETLMDWVPRDSPRLLARQWYRYGKGSVALQHSQPGALPADNATRRPPRPARETARRLVRHAAQEPADIPAVAGAFGIQLVFVAGRLAAKYRQHRDAGT